MNLSDALLASGVLAAVGVTLDAADLWRPSSRFHEFFDWRIIGIGHQVSFPSRFASRFAWIAAHPKALPTSLIVQSIAAWLFVWFTWQALPLGQVLSAVVVLLGRFHLHFRLVVGLDGSDQMQVILWVVLILMSAGRDTLVSTLALVFLVAQVVLSYLVSGIAKLISPIWRNGEAVGAIVSTREYGVAPARQLLAIPGISLLASWAVIIFEVLGPFLLLNPTVSYAFIAIGISFHLLNWIVMGLRSFVFAFVGTYPLILYAVMIFYNQF
jgi:hypothetical protein